MLVVPAKKIQGGSVGIFLTARRLAAALVLLMPLLVPVQAFGAGLGKLTVLSALGQPLSAEIEIVSLQPGEDDSLVVRLAALEAFRQSSVEFNPALLNVRFAIERRAGRPLVRLTSSQPLNEPFVELLVELSWNTGRLVREYTFLLDPPGYRGLQAIAPAPAAAVVAKPAPVAPPRVVEERPIAVPAPVQAAAPARPPVAAPTAKGTYEVKRGDTLAKIATQAKPPSATLQQMLIALYRANPDAFIDSNINRLRAGRILNLPSAESALAIDQEEARRQVAAQAQDFREYQNKLAGAVAAAPAQSAGRAAASGKISAPQDGPKSAEKKDQLKLSKADAGSKSAQSRAARGDDQVAREKAVRDTESRIAELEKSVQDLQRLLELKNQTLAELEKKGAAQPAPAPAPPVAAKPAPPVAAKPAPVVEPPKPVAEAPKPAAEAPKPAAEAPKPVPAAPKAAEAAKAPEPVAAPAGVATAPEAPKPAAAPPKPAVAPPKPAPPPPPPPSLIDEFMEDWRALGALGLILLALIGYGVFQWRRKKASQSKFQDGAMAAPAALGSASVFGGAAAGAAAAEGAVAEPAAASVASVAAWTIASR